MTTIDDAGQLSLTDLADAVEAAPDALTRLAAAAALGRRVREVERATVGEAVAAGRTWAAIGAQLGVSKQAVAKKYGTSSVEPVVPVQQAAKRAPKPDPGQWLILTPGGRTLLRVAKGPR